MKKEIISATEIVDRCDEVSLDNPEEAPIINEVIQNLKDTLRANRDMVALAAPQIGNNMRVFCIKFKNGDIRAFIDPVIVTRKGIHLSRETQIGFADTTEYIVPRNNEIHVAYVTPVNKPEVNAFIDVVGEVFQQMMDLIDGVLLSSYGLEIIEGFDKASKADKQAIIDMYLESLSLQQKALEEEIASDEELSRMSKSIDFMTKLSLGEIKTEVLTPEEKEQILKASEDK